MGLRQPSRDKAQTLTQLQELKPVKQVSESKPRKIKSAEDIIEAIAMIRDLIAANGTLRDKV